MAGTQVQVATAGSNTAVSSITTAGGAGLVATTAGNTLVAFCHLRTGSTQSVTSVTDSAGNTGWARDVSAFLTGNNTKTEIWRCRGAASVTSVTGTWSAALISSLTVYEIAGDTATVVTAGAGNAASTTPPATTVAAPGNAPVLGGTTYVNATAPTLAAPFTADPGFSAAAGPSYHANAHHVPATATTEGPTWTLPAAVASGSATIAFTAATGGTQALAGQADGTSTATGTLAVARALAGSAAGTSTTTGALAVARALAGTAAGSSTTTAALAVARALAGTAAGTSTTTAALAVARALAGTSDGTSTAGASIAVGRALAGTADGTSSAIGTLGTSGIIHALAGTATGSSTADGTLAVARAFAGTAAGTSSASGDLGVLRALAGAATGTSTAGGALAVARALAGAADGTSTAEGSLSRLVALEGTAAGTSTATGTLLVTISHRIAAVARLIKVAFSNRRITVAATDRRIIIAAQTRRIIVGEVDVPIQVFPQDPDEVLDYGFDWRSPRPPGPHLAADETIVTSVWEATPAGMTVAGATHDATTTTVWLSGGVNGGEYRVTNRITTTASPRTIERTFVVTVQPSSS